MIVQLTLSTQPFIFSMSIERLNQFKSRNLTLMSTREQRLRAPCVLHCSLLREVDAWGEMTSGQSPLSHANTKEGIIVYSLLLHGSASGD